MLYDVLFHDVGRPRADRVHYLAVVGDGDGTL